MITQDNTESKVKTFSTLGFCEEAFDEKEPWRKKTKPKQIYRKASRGAYKTATQVKKDEAWQIYLSKVRPEIPIDMKPWFIGVSGAEKDIGIMNIPIFEGTIGCDQFIPFTGAEPITGFQSFEEVEGYVELFNALNWGFKDGCTSLVVGNYGESETNENIFDIFESYLIYRDRGQNFMTEKNTKAPGTVLFILNNKDVVGTIACSENGTLVDFSLSYDRITRKIIPTDQYAKFREVEHMQKWAEFHIVISFNGQPTDIVDRINSAGNETYITRQFVLDKMPEKCHGSDEKMCFFGQSSLSTFLNIIRKVEIESKLLGIIIIDPRLYGVTSLVKDIEKKLLSVSVKPEIDKIICSIIKKDAEISFRELHNIIQHKIIDIVKMFFQLENDIIFDIIRWIIYRYEEEYVITGDTNIDIIEKIKKEATSYIFNRGDDVKKNAYCDLCDFIDKSLIVKYYL